MLHQNFFSASVSAVHRMNLRNGDVAFINYHQEVFREIVQDRMALFLANAHPYNGNNSQFLNNNPIPESFPNPVLFFLPNVWLPKVFQFLKEINLFYQVILNLTDCTLHRFRRRYKDWQDKY
jgi:cyclophilin family peptidyl-prolyl cis-trans isomerase